MVTPSSASDQSTEVFVYGKVKGPPEVDSLKMNRADVPEHIGINASPALSTPAVQQRLHVMCHPSHGQVR